MMMLCMLDPKLVCPAYPHKVLLNDNVLNFSVCQIKNLLNLDSAPNSIYGNKTIIYHLFNAAASQTIINQVSNLFLLMLLRKEQLDIGFVVNSNQLQQSLNDQLKIHASKTIHRKTNTFAIDFVNIPYYGEEMMVTL
ncbi:MAG: Pseudogene of ISH3 family transposase [Methanobrevibacter sp. CfCl-M3]